MGSDACFDQLYMLLNSDFNPRSPHGERRDNIGEMPIISEISIHAPRMGSDPGRDLKHPLPMISIHAPRMGSDRDGVGLFSTVPQFQSTLPAWGATIIQPGRYFPRRISIHAPRMGSDVVVNGLTYKLDYISIHAPRMGSDSADFLRLYKRRNFNPRSPHGERRRGHYCPLP